MVTVPPLVSPHSAAAALMPVLLPTDTVDPVNNSFGRELSVAEAKQVGTENAIEMGRREAARLQGVNALFEASDFDREMKKEARAERNAREVAAREELEAQRQKASKQEKTRLQRALEVVEAVWIATKNYFSALADKALGIFNDVWDGLAERWDNVSSYFSDRYEKIVSHPLVSKIIEKTQSTISAVTQSWRNIGEAVQNSSIVSTLSAYKDRAFKFFGIGGSHQEAVAPEMKPAPVKTKEEDSALAKTTEPDAAPIPQAQHVSAHSRHVGIHALKSAVSEKTGFQRTRTHQFSGPTPAAPKVGNDAPVL